MNADRLLEHYERIADAPDAIVRLRRFILDLAVRGKLVPQDSNDEPAAKLLKRIAAERARRVKAGEIRAPRASEPIREDELPIELPRTWAWARLCDIGKLSGGMTPAMNRADFWGGNIVWLSPKDIKADEVANSELKISAIGLAETRLELYRPGCLFMVARSGILKRTFPVAINRTPAAANQDMKVLTPFLEGQERYLQIMFRGLTDFILRELVKTGTTVQSLKYAEFELQPFPLPPLAEQRRIVAKVDELMALCDRLEAARRAREGTRDRLVAASLARLNAPDPETFQNDARFVLDALPALTTRPEQIKQLRQTILNLAVLGKLVPQDSNDEPAAKLLKRIAAERARRVKAGEIRAPRASEPIREDELPIELPRTWAWARLCDIGKLSGGMTPAMNRADFWGGNIVWLSPKDIKADEVANSELKISAIGLAETRLELYRPGCLFMVARSGILKRTFPVAINRTPAAANQDMKVLTPFLEGQERYLQIMFRGLTDFILRELVKTGTTVQSLKYAEFELQPFPLPPLAEQRRIVAKVDELMALCDRLESGLATAAETRRHLFDALLAEALAPAGSELEAAE